MRASYCPRSSGTPGFWNAGSCRSEDSGSRVVQFVLTKIVSPSTLPSLFFRASEAQKFAVLSYGCLHHGVGELPPAFSHSMSVLVIVPLERGKVS
jgi:hypothetical protein